MFILAVCSNNVISMPNYTSSLVLHVPGRATAISILIGLFEEQ